MDNRVYPCIQVWPFDKAPADLRQLSEHGGDEDWLAYVPVEFKDMYIGWLQDGGPFGCCDVSKHELQDGGSVYIGAHA